jgi:hypothetical protein
MELIPLAFKVIHKEYGLIKSYSLSFPHYPQKKVALSTNLLKIFLAYISTLFICYQQYPQFVDNFIYNSQINRAWYRIPSPIFLRSNLFLFNR